MLGPVASPRTKKQKVEPASAAGKAPDALTAPERHPFLAKIKPGVAKRFSRSRMEPLYEAVDVACYLVALGRDAEARGLVDDIAAGAVFAGNFNTWSPAANATSLAARLARLAGDELRRSTLVQRLVEHPAFATVDRPAFDTWMGSYATELERARSETSQKWACHRASRAVQGSVYFRETLGAGFYYDTWTTPGAIDAVIDDGISLLRERLPAQA
jgi:hypothetical protein